MSFGNVSAVDIINAYAQVFVLKSSLNVASVSPPVEYAWTRLQYLLNYTQTSSRTLSEHVAAMPSSTLLPVLFRSVIGDYMTGAPALNQPTCQILADPVTGYLAMHNIYADSNTVLVIIIVFLFCIIGYLMKRGSHNDSR